MQQASAPSIGSTFDVQAFLGQGTMSPARWAILTVCFFVLIMDGAQTSSMAFVAPALTLDLGISKLALGPVLSAALIGLAVGALTGGPLADIAGRKRVLIGAVLMFSFWSLLTSRAQAIPTLLLFRFLTGLGVGAAMPNCTTLVSEFVPAKQRAFLLNLMFCGFPMGASFGGFAAAWLIPHYGWRSVFLVGGVAPLVLAAALITMPESIAFMTVRKWPAQKIRAALLWVAGKRNSVTEIESATSFVITETRPARAAFPLRTLLATEYLTGTLMLWLAYFSGLLLYYLLTSWMPMLMRDAGSSVSRAASVTALFSVGGGIGALICGWLMDRVNATRVVSAAYFITALLLLGLSHSTSSALGLMWMTFLAGTAMNGAQTSLPILAASFYPTGCRASGVAWMLGIGRLGGVTGALVGGVLLGAGYGMASIVAGLAVVSVIASVALLFKDIAARQMKTASVS